MWFTRFKIDYALVGERDGNAGRVPQPALWRREPYRRGYADGLLQRAERVACGAREAANLHDVPIHLAAHLTQQTDERGL